MGSVTKTLEQLNSLSCQHQKNLLPRNMQINVKYRIQSAERHTKRRSGKSVIKLILEKHYIYLPARFNTISNDFLAEINSNKNYKIHSCGPWRNTYNLVFTNDQSIQDITLAYDVQDLLNNFDYCPTHYTSNNVLSESE